MHIAFNFQAITPPFTGVQRSAFGMVRSLLENNPEIDITIYAPSKFDSSLLPDAPNLRVKKSWLTGSSRTLRILWENFVLPIKLARDSSDLLHSPCYITPFYAPKPAIVNIHDLFAFTHPGFCKITNRAHFRRMIPRSIKSAKRVIVPCEAIKKEILDNFPLTPEKKIRVIPWGIDKRFQPVDDPARRQEVARRYELPSKFILHVGRGEPKKNIIQIIEAYFAAMMADKLPHSLVLCGPKGWGLPRLKQTISELGIESKIVQTGFVDDKDLPVLYSLADALVFPSLAEGFGFPVLEAMACGTPVIVSDIPAIRELAGAAAQRVPPGDLPALREAIEAVLGNESVATKLIEEGLECAKKYSWKKYGENLMQIYKEILTEGNQV